MEATAVTNPEERMRILKLVEEGKISPGEAARLLSAMDGDIEATQVPMAAPAVGVGGRWLKVRVTDTYSGHTKVNVNVPLVLVKMALGIGSRFVPEASGVDLNELRELVESGMTGKIVEVEDVEDGERVEVYVE
jgi:hypothetical protein